MRENRPQYEARAWTLTMEVIGQKLNFGHPIIASVLRRGFQLTQISLPAVRMVGRNSARLRWLRLCKRCRGQRYRR
jgi:hypothetical protein